MRSRIGPQASAANLLPTSAFPAATRLPEQSISFRFARTLNSRAYAFCEPYSHIRNCLGRHVGRPGVLAGYSSPPNRLYQGRKTLPGERVNKGREFDALKNIISPPSWKVDILAKGTCLSGGVPNWYKKPRCSPQRYICTPHVPNQAEFFFSSRDS